MMAEREFAIRLSAKGMDQVRSALKGMGGDGAQALRQIDTASQKATPGLKAVDTAARDLRSSFDAMAGRVPVIGGALQAMGPAGLAVGAGLAAAAAGMGALAAASRKAVEEIGALKDSADNLQLSVEDLQALYGQGLLKGIDNRAMEMMLQTLGINSARASEGFGKMKAALDKLDPVLGQQLAATESQAERLDILAKALRLATSDNEKLNIVTAAFGKEGAKMIRVLDESGASMDTWRTKAREAGLVLSEDLVNSVEELGDRLGVLDAKTAIAAQRFAVSAAPIIEWFESLKVAAIDAAGVTLDSLDTIQKRQIETLVAIRAEKQRVIAAGNDWFGIAASELDRIEAELEQRRAMLDEQEAAAKQRAGISAFSQWFDGKYGADAFAVADTAAAKAAEEAARAAAQAIREQQALQKQAIDFRIAEGDILVAVAKRQAELNALIGVEGVTREQVNAAVEKYRISLDGTAAAQARWQAVIEEGRTTLEKHDDVIRQLGDDYLTGRITLDTYRQALKQLVVTREELTAAEVKAAPAIAAVIEQQQEAKTATFELRFAAESLGGILDEQINSLEDLAGVATRTFRQMAIEWLLANQKMASGQNFMQFIGNAIGSFIGGGGFSTPGGDVAMSAYPGSVDPSLAAYGQWHTGGVIGTTPAVLRMMSPDMFAGAPRFHAGGQLGPGERAIIAEDGERMLSRMDNARIVRAVERGGQGGGNLTVNIINQAGVQVEQRERRGANGSRELDVVLTKKVQEIIGSGGADRPMNARFGIRPQAVG
jgi:hypothetical protein